MEVIALIHGNAKMVSMSQDGETVPDADSPESGDYPDAEMSHVLMEHVFEHYLKHHSVVLRKLVHAQDATLKSIQEIEELRKQIKADEAHHEFQTVKKYEKMWKQIIELFENSGLSEAEVQKVEDMLVTIPKVIKRYYEVLIQQDKVLHELIEELNSEKYKVALAAVKKIQSRPNLMTGLGPEEYEETETHQSFIFRVASVRGK